MYLPSSTASDLNYPQFLGRKENALLKRKSAGNSPRILHRQLEAVTNSRDMRDGAGNKACPI